MFNRTYPYKFMSPLLCGCLGAFLMQNCFVSPPLAIVTVDITTMVKSYERELMARHLSEEALSKQTVTFASVLNTVLDAYAAKHHCLLVPKEIVIAGGSDKTLEVSTLIKKQLAI
jgi:hypothetical protein